MVFSFLSLSLVLLSILLSLLISCQFVSIYLPFSTLIMRSTCPPRSWLHTHSVVCELQSLTQQTHITKSSCLTFNNPSSSTPAGLPARLSAAWFCAICLGPRCFFSLHSLVPYFYIRLLWLQIVYICFWVSDVYYDSCSSFYALRQMRVELRRPVM